MPTTSAQTILKSSLHSVLQSKLSSLKQASVLVISSKPANDAFVDPRVGSLVKKLHYHASMEFNLKVVQSTITSAFPTRSDVTKCIELAQRTGAGNLIAVGSGAAMDLCKLVSSQYDCDETILIPATSGGIIASSTSSALLLDDHEETILADRCKSITSTVVIDEIAHNKYAQESALLIGIDALYHRNDEDSEGAAKLFQLAFNGELTDALLCAGPLLSFGDNGRKRSPILTLATSLIPTVYPRSHILEFWASLLPEKIHNMPMDILAEYLDRLAQIQSTSPKLAEMSVANLPLSKLIEHIHDNQAVWNTPEVSDGIMEAILAMSLNR